jgi:hypothetical protein
MKAKFYYFILAAIIVVQLTYSSLSLAHANRGQTSEVDTTYTGLTCWPRIQRDPIQFDKKIIMLDGFVFVNVKGNELTSAKLFASKEALEYNRYLSYINLDVPALRSLLKKLEIVEPIDIEGLSGTYVQLTAAFSSEVPSDDILGVFFDIKGMTIGGGGQGRVFPRSLHIEK